MTCTRLHRRCPTWRLIHRKNSKNSNAFEIHTSTRWRMNHGKWYQWIISLSCRPRPIIGLESYKISVTIGVGVRVRVRKTTIWSQIRMNASRIQDAKIIQEFKIPHLKKGMPERPSRQNSSWPILIERSTKECVKNSRIQEFKINATYRKTRGFHLDGKCPKNKSPYHAIWVRVRVRVSVMVRPEHAVCGHKGKKSSHSALFEHQ